MNNKAAGFNWSISLLVISNGGWIVVVLVQRWIGRRETVDADEDHVEEDQGGVEGEEVDEEGEQDAVEGEEVDEEGDEDEEGALDARIPVLAMRVLERIREMLRLTDRNREREIEIEMAELVRFIND